MQTQKAFRRNGFFAWSLASAFGMFTVAVCPAISQDSIKDTSIKYAPIDADSYMASYKLKEQWNRLVNGPVAQQIMKVQGVKDAIEQFNEDWKEREGTAAQVRFYLENPNIRNALNFVQDLASDEMFYFADKNMSGLYIKMSQLNDEVLSQLSNDDFDPDDVAGLIQTAVTKLVSGSTCPTVVFGAKFSDEDQALTKLDELEGVLRLGLGSVPAASQVLQTLNRVEDARGSRLQWKLSGSQVPWEAIPTSDAFDEEARDMIRDLLSDKSITLTIGILDSYFLLALSPNAEAVNTLGSQKSLLDNEHLKILNKAEGKPVISVTYVSDAFSNASFETSVKNVFSRNFRPNIAQLKKGLSKESDSREFLDSVSDDLRWLDETIAKIMPPFRGSTSLTFLTDDGWERHDQIRTKDVVMDGTTKLDILNHVGGEPLLVHAARAQNRPEYFQIVRSIMQRVKARLDDIAKLDLDDINIHEHDRKGVGEVVGIVWPLLTKVADVWEKKFLPAINGEHAFVVSGGKLAAKQWAKEMPPSDVPLPLPEVATVTGVKDRELYKSGWSDLFAVSDEVLALVKKLHPQQVPEGLQIPRPTKDTSVAKVDKYSYPIPADCPAPKEMAPQGVLSDKYFVAGYSDSQSSALIAEKPLLVGKGIIDSSKPAKAVFYAHFGKLLEFAKPWVRYGLLNQLGDLDGSLMEDAPEDFPVDITGRDVVDLWDAFTKIGDISSVVTTTEDGGTWVRSVYRSRK